MSELLDHVITVRDVVVVSGVTTAVILTVFAGATAIARYLGRG